MRPNASAFPYTHAEPISKLEELNHPLIPKIVYYDDNEYEIEYIDGEDLVTYLERTGDWSTGILVYELVQDLMLQMSKISSNYKWNDFPLKGPDITWKLAAEDIHSKNIVITKEGKPYLIDLDQIGWWHPYSVFKLMNTNTSRIAECMRSAMITWDHKVSIERLATELNEIATELHEKNEELFENGVRHGFWNVTSKEEIKEKYEKYKKL
jgi:hypothetical protein